MKTKETTITGVLLLLGFLSVVPSADAFYNPSTGHWLSRDPIGEKDTPGLYAFVRNNALTITDKLGQRCCLRTYPVAPGSPFGHSVLTCGANNEIYVSFFPQSGSCRGQIPQEGSWHDPDRDVRDYANHPPTEVCTDCLDEGKVSDWVKKAKGAATQFADWNNCSDMTTQAIEAGLPPEKQRKQDCGRCTLKEFLFYNMIDRYNRDVLTDGGLGGDGPVFNTPSQTERSFKELVENGCNRWKCSPRFGSTNPIGR